MSTLTEISAGEPTIVMRRIYDAARDLVWTAMTESSHVRQWWGGPGFTNPVCEMDVRPGGRWRHVMRFPDGRELQMDFVFLKVDKPKRLVWQHADHGKRTEGLPTALITVTLEDLDGRTCWTMVARFNSMAERDTAAGMGFAHPIEASNDRLTAYLKAM